jgi:hypothetical protein
VVLALELKKAQAMRGSNGSTKAMTEKNLVVSLLA